LEWQEKAVNQGDGPQMHGIREWNRGGENALEASQRIYQVVQRAEQKVDRRYVAYFALLESGNVGGLSRTISKNPAEDINPYRYAPDTA
jgi:hypothetical protein